MRRRGQVRIESLELRRLLALTPAGSNFLVNSTTSGNQFTPAIASDSAGDFVVVWAGDGIHGQRYNPSGVAQGSEFQVNTVTSGVQSQPAVAMDSAGDFVVTWQNTYEVAARRFNASGVALDVNEFQVNTYVTALQGSPRVAMSAAGSFVIVWNSDGQDGSDFGVYARRYNTAGAAQGTEFRINQTTQDLQADPSVAMDRDGNFVVAWESGNLTTGQDGSLYGIYARRFNSSGTALSSEFQVNTYTTDYQVIPVVAVDTDGDFVIAWNSFGQDGSGYGVYARRFNSSGVAQGTEFRVNSSTSGEQSHAAIDIDGRGDFTIAFISSDGSGAGVFIQSYDYTGATVGSNTQVNGITTGTQTAPSIALNANGDVVVAWQDSVHDGSGYGIYAQRYTAPDQIPPTITAGTFNYLTSQSFSVSFSEDVGASLQSSDFLVENLTDSTTVPTGNIIVSFNSNIATVTFTSLLGDGNYRVTVIANGINDTAGNVLDGDNNGAPGGNYQFDFFVLAGDANRDRVVDAIDLGIIGANWRMAGNWSQGDFNYNGQIDVLDVYIMSLNWNKSLPALPPLMAATLTSIRTPPPAPIYRPLATRLAARPTRALLA